MKRIMWANVFLMMVWILFTETFQLERLIWGVIVIAGLQWLYAKRLHKAHLKINLSLAVLWCWVRYFRILLYEILKANIQVAILVLQPKIKLSQGYFYYKPQLKTEFAKMVFANSITLTPGTITVEYEGDQMIIHYLTEANTLDLENSNMERILLEMEALKCSS
ncbi:MAG: Na+/H+ antiporter subunit E [Clostridia bacterium]|nr:Na+/H+ antiporter subunit E [Clostridia bacterium]